MPERVQKGGESMTEKTNFELGEKKYVCISVRSTNRKPFDVTSAKYVLKAGDQIEKSGECEISKRSDQEIILSALIQPMIKGATYILEYTYEIPPEVLKYEVRVMVT